MKTVKQFTVVALLIAAIAVTAVTVRANEWNRQVLSAYVSDNALHITVTESQVTFGQIIGEIVLDEHGDIIESGDVENWVVEAIVESATNCDDASVPVNFWRNSTFNTACEFFAPPATPPATPPASETGDAPLPTVYNVFMPVALGQ